MMRLSHSAVGALALIGAPALADEVTFEVPVNVSNLLPTADNVNVSCLIAKPGNLDFVHGWAKAATPDASGSVVQTFVVKLPLPTGTIATTDYSYQCGVIITGNGKTFIDGVNTSPNTKPLPYPGAEGQAQPGTTPVLTVTGTIPRGQPRPTIVPGIRRPLQLRPAQPSS